MIPSKKNVLIIDNSPVIIKRLAALIKQLANVALIIEAGDYQSAINLLELAHIDIAIIDIHLHDGSGLDLLPRLTARFPAIIAIMLTNQPHDTYRAISLERGAAYFLDKSGDFARIPEIISAIA